MFKKKLVETNVKKLKKLVLNIPFEIYIKKECDHLDKRSTPVSNIKKFQLFSLLFFILSNFRNNFRFEQHQ